MDTSSLMEQILSSDNLNRAYLQVVRNKGAEGVDGMKYTELKEHLVKNGEIIKEQLRTRKYKPQPVRRVEIPKPDGGVRNLGVPTVTDRFIQQAIAQVLTPIYEEQFHDHSYGFRPNRCAQQAILTALDMMNDGNDWIVDIDLEKFFDTVNHDKLMTIIGRTIKDGDVISIVRKYLVSGIMIDDEYEDSVVGTPQGGNLSPLLANIMLNELDKEMEQRGLNFVRYADDCIIMVGSEMSAKRVMRNISRFIEEKLGLKVNMTKSKIDRPSGIKYLGFGFYFDSKAHQFKAKPHAKSVAKFKKRMKELTRRSWGVSNSYKVEKLNQLIRGWINYFKIGSMKMLCREMDKHIRYRLRMCIWKQWKTPQNRIKNLMKLGVNKDTAWITAYTGSRIAYVCQRRVMNFAINKERLTRFGLMEGGGTMAEKQKQKKFRNYMYEQQVSYLPNHMTPDEVYEHIEQNLKPRRMASILHDKDMKDDNITPAEAHIHIMLQFENARSVNQVAKDIGDKPERLQIWKGNVENGFSYLIHATDNARHKHQYSCDEVRANFDYPTTPYNPMTFYYLYRLNTSDKGEQLFRRLSSVLKFDMDWIYKMEYHAQIGRVLFICQEGAIMAIERRKDNKQRVLKEGEYQRANGTFEYKWRDKKGKRHSVYAKTLDELREKEIDILRDALDGIRADRKNITINDLYYRWEQLKKGLKANTFQNYKYMYVQFVEPDFGNMHITDLKRSDVRAFYNHLADERHVKANTIDNIHTVLHQVLELGVEDEYLRYNPSDNALKELKRAHNNDSEKRKALTVPEADLFEDFLAQEGQYHRWYPIFIVMLWTGMRVGEITGLRWCDIDLEEETINVNHTLVYFDKGGSERCGFAVNTPKTKAGERTIPMLPKVKGAFLMEKAYQEELGLKCNAVVDGYTDFIFINRFGGVQHQGTLNKALRRIIRDCNYEVLDKGGKDPVLLPKFSNHSLRHTFTTRMCEAGVNVKAMQDILGHADAETTLQIYADATKDLKKAEMINFEDYFKAQKMKQTGTD